jgi:hypothetical protein
MKKILTTITVLGSCGFAIGSSSGARAAQNFNLSTLSGFSNSSVESLVKTVGIASDHHAYMPASPLGILLGFDLGIDVTYVSFPDEFRQALATASQKSTADLPGGAGLPKLSFHKGLPMGIDVGFSFMKLPDTSNSGHDLYNSYGGDIKWAFIQGAALPAVAARFSASWNNLYFIKTKTFSFDALVSKDLFIIDPYAGAGLQFWSGELSVPGGVQVPGGISTSASSASPRVFAGALLKLTFLKVAAEADYSTSGVTSLGGKVSLGF